MGKVKSIFTMATLHLIKVLLDFSSRVLPVFIIAIALLKLAKVFELDWRLVIAVLVLEVILIIITIVFYSLFFKNTKSANQNNTNSSENNTNVIEKPKKLPVLNIAAVFFIFLGIIFIILKLFKAVTWSWVWVLSPLWLSTALTISILIICVIVSIISAVSKKNKENDNKGNNSEAASNIENKDNSAENNSSNENNSNNSDGGTNTNSNNQ